MSVNIAIERAKQIIDNNGFCCQSYKGCQPGYFVTNENIDAYLQIADFENKDSALTVLSSGDQAFSLATKGITNIDTFDINELQEYIALGLKRAMIEKYNYNEFISNIKELVSAYTLENVSSIICDLLPLMDKKYRFFWQNVIDYYCKDGNRIKNLILILCREAPNINMYFKKVPFLRSEEEYNKLRNVIGKINITFKNIDAMNLGEEYAGNKYDFILLSNILNYISEEFEKDSKLIKYIKSLESISQKDGIIFLLYLYFQYKGELTKKNINYYDPFDKLSLSQIFKHCISIENLYPKNDFGRGGMIFKRMNDKNKK